MDCERPSILAPAGLTFERAVVDAIDWPSLLPNRSLTLGSAGSRQTGFLSQLCVNLRQVFPEPFVALPAQQGVLTVVHPAALLVADLLRSESFFLHL